MTFVKLALVGLMVGATLPAYAEDKGAEMKQDVKEAAQDAKTGMKKAGRKVKDETCEMVNGKMECAAKKGKHKVQNAVDDLKD